MFLLFSSFAVKFVPSELFWKFTPAKLFSWAIVVQQLYLSIKNGMDLRIFLQLFGLSGFAIKISMCTIFPREFQEMHVKLRFLLGISGIASPDKFPVMKFRKYKKIRNPSRRVGIVWKDFNTFILLYVTN